MIITEQILTQGKSDNGSWSRKQVLCLGVDLYGNSGWRRKLVGTDVPAAAVDKFLLLRNDHLLKKKDRVSFNQKSLF